MQVTALEGLSWYHLKLEPGSDLFQSLREFMDRQELKRAFVLYCIGSLQKIVGVYPITTDIPPELGHFTREGLFEMNVIAGEVWRDGGEIKVHLHGSVTKEGTEVFGGAIREGTTLFRQAEMVIAAQK